MDPNKSPQKGMEKAFSSGSNQCKFIQMQPQLIDLVPIISKIP